MQNLILCGMSEEDRRVGLTRDLRLALREVADLSDRIVALRTTHHSADPAMRALEDQRVGANARASELRRSLTAHDEAQNTPVPR